MGKNVCTRLFTAALFVIVKDWKRRKCPHPWHWLDDCGAPTQWSFVQLWKKKKGGIYGFMWEWFLGHIVKVGCCYLLCRKGRGKDIYMHLLICGKDARGIKQTIVIAPQEVGGHGREWLFSSILLSIVVTFGTMRLYHVRKVKKKRKINKVGRKINKVGGKS